METKPRILYLQKILLERTDEENPLSTTQFYSFYKTYPEIFQTSSGKSVGLLSWSHYATLLQVKEMDMYIRMYDELKRSEGDNPTIGIVLCSDTDDDIARYSVMHGNEQLFASKYKLYLPTKEELKAEIETQKAMFYL